MVKKNAFLLGCLANSWYLCRSYFKMKNDICK